MPTFVTPEGHPVPTDPRKEAHAHPQDEIKRLQEENDALKKASAKTVQAPAKNPEGEKGE